MFDMIAKITDPALWEAVKPTYLKVIKQNASDVAGFDIGAPTAADPAAQAAQADVARGLYDDVAGLPPDKQGEAVEKLSPAEFKTMIDGMPLEQKEDLGTLIEKTHDPVRKLLLYREFHKGETEHRAHDAIAATPDDQARDGAIERARRGEAGEVDDEVTVLLAEKGQQLSETDVEKLMRRKELELDIEMRRGVNLTNDRLEDLEFSKAEGHIETRQEWQLEELQALDRELDRLPPEHYQRVVELRRKDGDAENLHHPDGRIQVGTSPDLKWKAARVSVHEIGHDVAMQDPAMEKLYNEQLGWVDYGEDPAAVEAVIGKGQVEELQRQAKNRGAGAFSQSSVKVGDKTYVLNKDGTFHAYDTAAIPAVGEAELTEKGPWRDELDYARTTSAEMFAEHYNRAVRDPVRVYQDFVEGPGQAAFDAFNKLTDLQKNGGSAEAVAAATKELEEKQAAAKRRGELFDTMRTKVFGVTDDKVAAAAASLPPDQQEAFTQQAKHCCTPDQLESLHKAYERGSQVDDQAIQASSAGVPEAQRGAFALDARNCFTAVQLERLRDAYARGERVDGAWQPNQLPKVAKDEHYVLSY